MALKPAPKLALVALAIAGVVGGAKFLANKGYIHGKLGQVLAPHKYDLPPLQDAKIPNVQPLPYPSSSCASSLPGPVIHIDVWEWNAMQGLLLANGGACTTEGSIMAKLGVNVHLTRVDVTPDMMTHMVSCSKDIKGGASECSGTGANAVIIMGDQSAATLSGAQKVLKSIGSGMKIIVGFGYSRGEDAFMAPPSLRDNPHSIAQTVMYDANENELPVHGLLVGGSISEGDWDIAMKWAGDNNIKNNPDIHTFAKDALNWMSEPDYNTAAADYVAAKCEDRSEVKIDDTGKSTPTGNKVHVCLNGVVTWTPGDVTVATKRGGLVKVADSKQYRSMMPAVLIVETRFLAANRDKFKALMTGAFEGANQLKAFEAARKKAAQISAKVYADEGMDGYSNGEYWFKFFNPVEASDKQHLKVSLGGSAVNNLEDNIILFGLNGNNNNMVASYNIFRSINLQQYPDRFKADGNSPLPEAKDVIDRSLISELADEASNGGQQAVQADTQTYTGGTGRVVSSRSYAINFANGKADILPDGITTLRGILDSIAITGLKVKIDGYTDNTGSAQINTTLSQNRADAVRQYMQQKAGHNFPSSRFVSVQGHGPDHPVGDNSTPDGRAANRRVEITLID